MSGALDRAIERWRQLRRSADATVSPATLRRLNAPPGTDPALAPGRRVFDTVSGLEGEVVHGSRENIVVPAPAKSDR